MPGPADEDLTLTVLLFVILRLLLRRMWLSVIVGGAILVLVSANNMGGTSSLIWIFPLMSGVLLTVVLVRFGLLPFAVALFVPRIVSGIPFTLEMSHWSAAASNWTLVLLMALTAFGFYAARAGQPLFGSMLKE